MTYTREELDNLKLMLKSPDVNTIRLVGELIVNAEDNNQKGELYHALRSLETTVLASQHSAPNHPVKPTDDEREVREALEEVLLDLIIDMAYDKP